jgi:hypothetical protein
MVEPTFLLRLVDITPAFAPRDAIGNNVSKQDAGFGYKNRANDGQKNL